MLLRAEAGKALAMITHAKIRTFHATAAVNALKSSRGDFWAWIAHGLAAEPEVKREHEKGERYCTMVEIVSS